MEQVVMEIIRVAGLPGAILAACLWYFITTDKARKLADLERDRARVAADLEREKRTDSRLDELESYIRERLDGMLERATQAIQQQADASNACAHANRNMLQLLQGGRLGAILPEAGREEGRKLRAGEA